jgi:hypothetical protein
MRAVLFAQLPDSARRAIAPALPDDVRALVVFDASRLLAERLTRAGAFQRDGILVLPRSLNDRRS